MPQPLEEIAEKALVALLSGDASTAIATASEALDGTLIRQAFVTGVEMGRAERAGCAPTAAMGAMLAMLVNSPAAPAGFKMLRQRFGISRAAVAAKTGAHPRTVAFWEEGKVKISEAAIAALLALTADAIPVPPAPLLTGDWVYNTRLALGLTQGDFAAALGITRAAVTQWEARGSRPIPTSGARRIVPLAREHGIALPAAA